MQMETFSLSGRTELFKTSHNFHLETLCLLFSIKTMEKNGSYLAQNQLKGLSSCT